MRIDSYSPQDLVTLNNVLYPIDKKFRFYYRVHRSISSSRMSLVKKDIHESTGEYIPFDRYTVESRVLELNEYRIHKHCTNLSDSLDVLIEFDQLVPVIFFLIECSMENLPLLISSSYDWVRDLVQFRLSINK